ncbi:hypothetical protein Ahy_A09g043355 [Arachis hypogaea]|uniref:Phosphate transporter n=1 Tax=Arachis hypogaea TaxID=3818 RepID=A0A445BI38_ARAHY|nr:hypothetical protein Ahy_A09g043355 [Arachis hypogaea]
MVKFSKELEAQLIPEWKEAFVNYWQLKKQIKRIRLSRLPTNPPHTAQLFAGVDFGRSIFDSLRSIAANLADNLRPSCDDHNLTVIQVRRKTVKGSEEEIYETELAQLFSEEDEVRVFFESLDEELNKVNQFYKKQESEFMERGDTLNKQLQILLDLKTIISNRRWKSSNPSSNSASFSHSPSRNSDYSVAFSKILKKFDKVSCQKASANYLKEVKRSHFVSSDKVVRLMDEVESIFTKHFANNDRKKAMKFLRPQQNKDSHMVTFLVGLSTGCFVSLFCVYAILAHLCGIFSPSKEPRYMETVYPVFSVFALLSLHLFMYGCNLFMWKRTRINYNFIFEFSPTTALKHRDAFLICTTLMTTVVGAMVIHLLLRAAGFSPSQVDAIPGILLLVSIMLLICPFDFFYRPTRYCFIRVLRNIACSPFYKVLLVDFFMADQLTSQIPLLRHLETTSCRFFATIFKTHNPEACHSGRLYLEITYIISFMPYYWRALQCARRWFDDSDVNHLKNMGKYVSAMVAAGARVTYSRQDNHLWFVIVLITSTVATVYQLYWDFIKDWGFLNPNSKNPWLRDDLILKNKSIYYMSIALNVVLRLTWVETILHFKVGRVQSRLLEFLLASLEVIRRGHWNFYRLENEHLNNVGRYRAVKTVPLPFREMDSD